MKRSLVVISSLSIASTQVACGPSAPSHTTPAPPATSEHATHAGHHGHHPHEGDDGRGPLVHRFEKADDWAPVFDDPTRDAWQQPDRVVAALALAPGMIVADVGAGTGYFVPRLSSAVGAQGKVLAVDVEPDMVRYLTERAVRDKTPNVTAVLSTLDDPKLAPSSVDRILVVDTWHHIADRVAYTRKLATALRPGGFVLVVDFTLESAKGPPKQHRIAPAQVASELEQAGLAATTVDAGLSEQFVIKGAK